MLVGIDASNLRGGGGSHHLRWLLEYGHPPSSGIEGVVLWASPSTLDRVGDAPWLKKAPVEALEGHLFTRALWQQSTLPSLAAGEGCDVIFSPGGTVPLTAGLPTVTMFRNALPFEATERRRYPAAKPARWRLEILKRLQSLSMRRANGVIYLSDYGLELGSRHASNSRSVVIPHGVANSFFAEPRAQRDISEFSLANPYQILYVSPIRTYKHHIPLIRAVASVRASGYPVSLTLVGGSPEPKLASKVERTVREVDPASEWIHFAGHVDQSDLPAVYRRSDLFAFPSTCENLPNTLLEAMASGLPIATARNRPMPETARAGAEYFDATDPTSISTAISALLTDKNRRAALAGLAFSQAASYSWEAAALQTFQFLAETARLSRS